MSLNSGKLEIEEKGSSINPLAALIAPLAGLALLGAASAVAVNPILLQLVTINKDRNKRESEGLNEIGNQIFTLKAGLL
jgi:hypothetical protein